MGGRGGGGGGEREREWEGEREREGKRESEWELIINKRNVSKIWIDLHPFLSKLYILTFSYELSSLIWIYAILSVKVTWVRENKNGSPFFCKKAYYESRYLVCFLAMSVSLLNCLSPCCCCCCCVDASIQFYVLPHWIKSCSQTCPQQLSIPTSAQAVLALPSRVLLEYQLSHWYDSAW